MADGATAWATRCFGDRAGELADRIVGALAEAHHIGTRTQQASGQPQRYAYGSTWISRFERLVEHLQDLPGAEVVRVPRTSYRLVQIDGRLLIPFVLARALHEIPATRRLASDILRALAARTVPAPQLPMSLFDLDQPSPTRRPEARHAAPGQGLDPVFVGVVCHADDADLRAVFWGQATSIDDGGVLTWQPRRLPLPRPDGHDDPDVPDVPAPREPEQASVWWQRPTR